MSKRARVPARVVALAFITSTTAACAVVYGLDGLKDRPPAAADAGPTRDPDGADSFVCPPNAFCDGFERDAGIGPWDQQELAEGGALDLTGHAKSGNNALRVTLSAQDGCKADLERPFPRAKAVRVTYSLFMSTMPARMINLSPVTLDNGAHDDVVSLQLTSSRVSFFEHEVSGGVEVLSNPLGSATPVLGQWVDVSLDIDLTTSPPNAVLFYAGQQVFAGALQGKYQSSSPSRIIVGASFSNEGPALSFDIDDVAVTTTPP